MPLWLPKAEDDALTESELAELNRNLLLLSGPHVQNFYRDAHKECPTDVPLRAKKQPKTILNTTEGRTCDMIDIKWQEVITSIGTAVGGGGVLLAAGAYLSKEIVTHKLRQEFAVFTTGLQTQYAWEDGMKTILLVLISVGLGFVLGRVTAPAPTPDHTQIPGASVDCYDSQGSLVRDDSPKPRKTRLAAVEVS